MHSFIDPILMATSGMPIFLAELQPQTDRGTCVRSLSVATESRLRYQAPSWRRKTFAQTVFRGGSERGVKGGGVCGVRGGSVCVG